MLSKFPNGDALLLYFLSARIPSNAPAKLRRANADSKRPPTSRAPAASAGG